MSVCIYMYITQYLLRPEEGVRSCGTGATGSCEKPDCVLGTEFRSSGRSVSALTHWVTSLAPPLILRLSHGYTLSPLPTQPADSHPWNEAGGKVKGIQLRAKLSLLAVAWCLCTKLCNLYKAWSYRNSRRLQGKRSTEKTRRHLQPQRKWNSWVCISQNKFG